MRKGNQVQMCVKLDVTVSELLSMVAMVTAKPKNRIINEGVILYCNLTVLRREYMNGNLSDKEAILWLKHGVFQTIDKGGKE